MQMETKFFAENDLEVRAISPKESFSARTSILVIRKVDLTFFTESIRGGFN